MTIKDDLIKEIEEGKEIHYSNRKVYGDIDVTGFGLAQIRDDIKYEGTTAKFVAVYDHHIIDSGICDSKDEAIAKFKADLKSKELPKTGKLYWRHELEMESEKCFDSDSKQYRLRCRLTVSES